MSAAVAEPDTRATPRHRDGLFHFACTLRRAAAARTATSVRCLCGKSQPYPRPAGRGSAGMRCVVCADLAPAHLAVCAPCRWASA